MCGAKMYLCITALLLVKISVGESQRCTPNERTLTEDGCKECICTSLAQWVCKPTDTPACEEKTENTVSRRKRDGLPIKDLKTTPCAPNDFFELDCNTCYCNGQGTGYLCTAKICPITIPPSFTTSSMPASVSSTSAGVQPDKLSLSELTEEPNNVNPQNSIADNSEASSQNHNNGL